MVESTTVAIVWHCWLPVERYAAHGREIQVPRSRCPDCRQQMVFWSGYWRYVREEIERQLFIHRACCQRCSVTHALLPSFLLHRRLDPVRVIGRALGGWCQTATPTAAERKGYRTRESTCLDRSWGEGSESLEGPYLGPGCSGNPPVGPCRGALPGQLSIF